jgi:hypothetical protein
VTPAVPRRGTPLPTPACSRATQLLLLAESGEERAVVLGAATETIRAHLEPSKLTPQATDWSELNVAAGKVLDDGANHVRKLEHEQVVPPDDLSGTAVGIPPSARSRLISVASEGMLSGLRQLELAVSASAPGVSRGLRAPAK